MKKLLILSVLLGLMALPMFASDVTFGGDVTLGYNSDFGDNYSHSGTLTTDIMATIDDYNSLVIEQDWLDGFPDMAVVTTDVGMWLGLPVGLVVAWGWDDPDANEFHSISEYDNEEVFDLSTGDYWGFGITLSASFFEIELAMNPTGEILTSDDPPVLGDPGELLAGLAVKEPIPGLNAEVYYYQGRAAYDEFGEGQIMFDAAYSAEFGGVGLDAGAAFFYPLDPDAPALLLDYDWAFGVAAAASVSMLDFTLGLNGDSEDILGTVSASAVVAPIDMVSIFAGLWYDVADAEELAEAEFGINAHIGAAEMYVGYLLDNGGGGDHFNAPPSGIGDDGAFIKFDIDY